MQLAGSRINVCASWYPELYSGHVGSLVSGLRLSQHHRTRLYAMSSAVPKIIIKPRPSAAPTVTIPAPGTFSRLIAPAPPSEQSDDPADGDDDPQAMDVDSPADGLGGDEAGGPRLRGRPKGRGRGLASGTSTPRMARGRGRGRARGKARVGGSLLIRLPKRGDDEADADVEGDVEGEGAEGEGEVGDGAEAELETPQPEEPKEKEEPLGGGKPFRKIQGKVYVIDGDEFVTDDDPKGDEKIDRSGVLLGGESHAVVPCPSRC